LNSDDVNVANKIARAIRFSSGGLRFVQALGFLVEGQAQVSMNLTDFKKTPIHLVQEIVRREAARYGLAITRAELVGLIPQMALIEAAKWYLQLDELGSEQVLEIRIANEEEVDTLPISFLEATAAGTPTPGGGSVAALAGALGAALAQMVANLTVGRQKYAQVDAEARSILEQAGSLRQRLTAAINEDSAAFDALMAAWRNKKLSQEDRRAAIKEATIHASEVPLEVARLAMEVARLSLTIVTIGNSNALTDGAAGGLMARAAMRIAALNVKVNAMDLEDSQLTNAWLSELESLESEIAQLEEVILSTASERGGF
jgi:glutamate formiminotransferase/formiminotetrahydrofolate cyclodeaminase